MAKFTDPATFPNGYTFTTCVRFDRKNSAGDTVPRLYFEGNHHTVGFDSVSVDADGWLVLEFADGLGPFAIGAPLVCVDETLVSRGISMGASGGTPLTRYKLMKNGAFIRADGPEVYGSTANAWILSHVWDL